MTAGVLPEVCPECGNDDVCEGEGYCSDCLDSLGHAGDRPPRVAGVPLLPEHLQQRGGSPDLLWRELNYMITTALDTAPRTLQTELGPSEIGDECARRMGHKLLGSPRRQQPPNWKAYVGTTLHAGLASILDAENVRCAPDLGGLERFLVEFRVEVGAGVFGTVDWYDQITGTVGDWKTCGRTMLRKYRTFGPGATYQLQAHLYGLGIRATGRPVDTVMIVFLPRQGDLSEAYVWSEPFDPELAQAALQRYDGVRTLVEAMGPAALDALPMAPAWCTHCPFYDDPQGSGSCPGHPDSRPPLDQSALTYNGRPDGFSTK